MQDVRYERLAAGRPWLHLGVRPYRLVRRYLERRPKLTLRRVDALIGEIVEYRNLINLKTKEQE